MGKSSRRNRPSKAERKKNAIVARNNNFYNIMNCKSTSKTKRAITGGSGRADVTNKFKKDITSSENHRLATFKTHALSWSPLL